MHGRRLFNGLAILGLLLPTMMGGSAAPTRASGSLKPTAHGRTLIADETAENLSLRPFVDAGYGAHSQAGEGERTDAPSEPLSDLSDFSASVLQATAASNTWDSDADFAGGTFDHTEVLSGTGQVTLLRRWTANVKANDDPGSANPSDPSLAADGSGNLYLAWTDERNGYADVYFARSTDDGTTWLTNRVSSQ